MSSFKKAVKSKSKLRLGLIGPSGSGKTYSALAIATKLGGKVAVIDTEHGSASKYADIFEFDVLELESFGPLEYVKAIQEAADAGYSVIVVDSLSHAWIGRGGALELVDNAAVRSKSNNSFAAWREVTPQHNQMIEAIIRVPAHIICTMRSKTEYVMEKDERTGKTAPRKVGLAPVQRDGLEYEFDVVGDIDHDHRLVVTKSRIPALADSVVVKPGAEMAETLKGWLESGVEVSEPVAPAKVDMDTNATTEQLENIKKLAGAKGLSKAYFDGLKVKYRVKTSADLTVSQANDIIKSLSGGAK